MSLVVTTVGDGKFLDAYGTKIREEGVEDRVTIIVIPDRKTPRALYEKCGTLRASGIRVDCPPLEEQEEYLKKLGAIHSLIPYDSDNRRNIGYLMALQNGSDVVISIDDDNYCRPGSPFFKEHAIVAEKESQGEVCHSSHGWLNVCELMEVDAASPVYPRGFPYKYRHKPKTRTVVPGKGAVHVNAGLWLGHPDLDAHTWLTNPARTTAFRGNSYLLGESTWTPINTQNTALHRDAVAAYYFIPMGYTIEDGRIDRFGDIFSGYFVEKCAKHLGYHIRVGTPVANHIRNAHNYAADFEKEQWCVRIIERMINWLRGVKLAGGTYRETYASLADAIDEAAPKLFLSPPWHKEVRAYLKKMSDSMRVWLDAAQQVGA